MLKLKDVPEENVGQVIRTASEMQMKEEEAARQKSATVAAAEEVGISEEYLEKATQKVHADRVHEIQQKRRRNQILAGIGATVALGAGIAFVTRPPAPATLATGTVGAVTSRISAGTVAQVTPVGTNGVTVRVEGFGPNQNGTYFANAELKAPTSLAGYRNMSFTVSGEGLQNVRIDFENGTERWKGPNISIPAGEQKVTLDFKQFQRQEQRGGQWRTTGYRAPGSVQQVTVKTGDTVNPPGATGSVTVRDVTFQ